MKNWPLDAKVVQTVFVGHAMPARASIYFSKVETLPTRKVGSIKEAAELERRRLAFLVVTFFSVTSAVFRGRRPRVRHTALLLFCGSSLESEFILKLYSFIET